MKRSCASTWGCAWRAKEKKRRKKGAKKKSTILPSIRRLRGPAQDIGKRLSTPKYRAETRFLTPSQTPQPPPPPALPFPGRGTPRATESGKQRHPLGGAGWGPRDHPAPPPITSFPSREFTSHTPPPPLCPYALDCPPPPTSFRRGMPRKSQHGPCVSNREAQKKKGGEGGWRARKRRGGKATLEETAGDIKCTHHCFDALGPLLSFFLVSFSVPWRVGAA